MEGWQSDRESGPDVVVTEKAFLKLLKTVLSSLLPLCEEIG